MMIWTSGWALAAGPGAAKSPAMDEAAKRRAVQMLQSGPAVFIENQGQWEDETVRFALSSMGANVGLTNQALRFQLMKREAVAGPQNAPAAEPRPRALPGRPDPQSSMTMRMHEFKATFAGANPAKPVGVTKSPQTFNFRRGDKARWREGVTTWESVRYPGLYKGIDLQVMGRKGGIKYEFHVAPGADWKQIALHYENIGGLKLREDGALELIPRAGWAPLVDGAPVIYQETAGGEKKSVDGRFRLIDPQTTGFEVTGAYDTTKPLVIDPDLAWGTYLGGNGYDYCRAVTVDAQKNIYIVGQTGSAGWVSGGYNTSFNTNPLATDAFVAKISPTGQLVWSTYLGGGNNEDGRALAVDGSGNIYATGSTNSPDWLNGGYNSTYSTTTSLPLDGFVIKLSSSGQPVWGTYLGGLGTEVGLGITLDNAGNPCVTGKTNSKTSWVSGGFKTTPAGGYDAFVVKLTAAGQHSWSTYLGGTLDESGLDIACDSSNNFFVTGTTNSSGWVSGGYLSTLNTKSPFVAKISSTGQHLWSTYLGGHATAIYGDGNAIALDGTGNIYLAGTTLISMDRSVSECAAIPDSGSHAYVIALSAAGQYQWSAWPGEGNDNGNDIVVSGANVCLTGMSLNTGWVTGGFNATNRAYDAFVALFNSATGQPVWSTYLGGTGDENGLGIAADSAGDLVVCGYTKSAGWLTGGYDSSYALLTDGFVAKINHTSQISTGSLSVTITPPSANTAGARWRRVGTTPWLTGGATESGLVTGHYTVEFADVTGWTKPANAVVVVNGNQLSTATATYQPPSGSLSASIYPPEAVTAGAMWRRTGMTLWQNSGATEAGVPVGASIVEFRPLTGWDSPTTQSVAVSANQLTQTSGTYTRQTGALAVTLTPPEAVTAGAQWRRVGTTPWLDSGTTETALPTGNYQVEFKTITGWTAPTTQPVTVNKNKTTTDSEAYVKQVATLEVDLQPTSAVLAGAQWRLQGSSTWQNSGDKLADLPYGTYKIEFSSLTGWITPATASLTINNPQPVVMNGMYVLMTGKLHVALAPPAAAAAGAAWRPLGTTTWLDSNTTVTGLPIGNQTLEFNGTADWLAPSRQTVNILYNQTVNTTYTLTRKTGSLRVTLTPASVVSAGAQWRRAGATTWLNSGASESGIPTTSSCTVEFSHVNGWRVPATKVVSIKYLQTTSLNVACTTSTASLSWSSYLGGSSSDTGQAVAVDGQGYIYVTGTTYAAANWTTGGYDTTFNGGASDIYVAKISPTGQLVWSTYLGGNVDQDGLKGADFASSIALDKNGNIFVGGSTTSVGWTSGGYATNYHGNMDGFAIKLSTSGAPLWSTYIGGTGSDYVNALAVDTSGTLYAIGHTESTGWVSGGANTNYLGGAHDGFIVKLASNGAHVWSTYVGGSDDDQATGGAIDAAGNLYVVGNTLSAGWTSVATGWASVGYNTTQSGAQDGFITKYSPAGLKLWSGYLGGIADDSCSGVAIDGLGYILVTGTTASPNWLWGGYKSTKDATAYENGYVVRLTPAGQYCWGTYVGGGVDDTALGIVADSLGNAYVTGATSSSGWVTDDLNNTLNGGVANGYYDAYAIKLSPGGLHLWSTYLGASGIDNGNGIAVDPSGNVIVVGNTSSAGWVSGGFDTSLGGTQDAFVAKINDYYRNLPVSSLKVTLSPSLAVTSGARWRRLGTSNWLASGVTESNLPAGSCAIEFQGLTGWLPVAGKYFTLAANQTLAYTGTYVPNTGLKVTILPAAAVSAGAQWRRVGTTVWFNSAQTEPGVLPGSYQVEFKPLTGWKTPARATVSIVLGQTTQANRSYVSATSAVEGGDWTKY